MKTISDSVAVKTTAQFIEENPSVVVLVRRTKTPTTAGGFKWTNPLNRPPQVMRSVLQTIYEPIRHDESGEVVVPTMVLIGTIDADVQRWDLVEIDGLMHKVVWVTRRKMMQRTAAELVQNAT